MNMQDETEYEDLLGLWSDLEAGLGVVLGHPHSIQEFGARIGQYDRWMQALLKRETDVGLYLLFQLATHSTVGYSASHALVSAVLCHLIADELPLPGHERDSLVNAAFTMNIGMTALQDELATQMGKPTSEQQDAIRTHPMKGGVMLSELGVTDELWLDIVSSHHDEASGKGKLRLIPPASRLSRVLRMVDRYAAMISPRKSRSGRTAADSVRAMIGDTPNDEVGLALVRTVGLCPPGTFVRLDNEDVAVVVRRSAVAHRPDVAIVLNSHGEPLRQPRLHRTSVSPPHVQGGQASAGVPVRLNHHRILQLGADVRLGSG